MLAITRRRQILISLSIVLCASLIIIIYEYTRFPSRTFNVDVIREQNAAPRIMCLIFTKTANFVNRTKMVNATWAKDCDKHFFVTKVLNKTLKKHRIMNINTLPVLQPRNVVDESYDKLTDRLYYTYMDIYKLYPDYDFYLKTDDDTFIFVDNLRDFLKDKNPNEPVTFGYDFRTIVEFGFPSGGAGFVLSHEAVKRLVTELNYDYKFCENTGVDDVDVAHCLRKLNVFPSRTYDDKGRERFHPLDIQTFITGTFPDWMYDYAKNPIKTGVDCCSNTTISFHYTETYDMEKMYKLWQTGKRRGLTNDENIEKIIKAFTP